MNEAIHFEGVSLSLGGDRIRLRTEDNEAANRAAREEMDDDAYIEWIGEQRVLYERGMYRLTRIPGHSPTERRLIRIVLRAVVIDGTYPNKSGQVSRLRIGLHELADVWGIE